ncbi:MAG: cupin domain-containing protein [Gammaproteobacteria bacterium]|nr:cupin domain-containing protein [Gammaproteobacteria bacterium]
MTLKTLLGDISPDTFLRDYWQQKPLLVRQALPGFQGHLSGEELAGLALEEDVESRLVIEQDGERPWQVKHGPLEEADFLNTPDSHWTLLVQEMNRHLPEVAEMFDYFAFLPSWRLDDIMISYADDQGSVGPHVDNYDVFLLQASGTRRWQISNQVIDETDLIPDIEMRIMQGFEAEQEWLLEPGDMLYLPPRLPHYGVAQGPCITYSIGFRAPTLHQMWSHFIEYLQQLGEDSFYRDPDMAAVDQSGRITPQAQRRVHEMMRSLPLDNETLDEWFGRFITDPVRGVGPEPLSEDITMEQFLAPLHAGESLYRSEETRFAYYLADGDIRMYINGQHWDHKGVSPSLIRLIADRRHYTADDLAGFTTQFDQAFLLNLHQQGLLGYLESEHD